MFRGCYGLSRIIILIELDWLPSSRDAKGYFPWVWPTFPSLWVLWCTRLVMFIRLDERRSPFIFRINTIILDEWLWCVKEEWVLCVSDKCTLSIGCHSLSAMRSATHPGKNGSKGNNGTSVWMQPREMRRRRAGDEIPTWMALINSARCHWLMAVEHPPQIGEREREEWGLL